MVESKTKSHQERLVDSVVPLNEGFFPVSFHRMANEKLTDGKIIRESNKPPAKNAGLGKAPKNSWKRTKQT